MAAYNIVISAFKNGTVDAETITVAFDDATDVAKTARIVTPAGVQAGVRIHPNDRTIRIELSSIAEYDD